MKSAQLLIFVFLQLYTGVASFAQPNWVDKSNGVNGGEVSSLALNGANLYAGTNGGGIFLLADGTTQWARLSNGFDSGNAAFVYAIGVNGANVFVGTGNGVYFSTNGGNLWSKANINNSDSDIRSILISGSTIYAGSYFGNINISLDNGITWKTVKLPATGSNPTVVSLALKGAMVLAGTYSNGLFISSDGGNTWVANNSLANSYINSLAVSGNNIYAGTIDGVFLSSNNGSNWSSISNGLSSQVISSMSITGNSLYVGTSGGISVTKDNGTSWTSVTNNYTNSILIASGLNLFVGTTKGVFFSGDEGSNWSANNNGLTAVRVNCFNSSGSSSFMGTPLGVFASQNGGASWTLSNSGLTSTYINAILINNNYVYAGSNSGTAGLFRSADNGITWVSLGNPGPNYASSLIYALTSSNNYIFAATTNGIYRSADSGTTWSPASTTISRVLSLAVDGATLYAGTDAFSSNSAIYFSTDNGDNWTKTAAAFNSRINGLAVTGNNVYAATGLGVYVSHDKGATWANANSGNFTGVILVNENPVVSGSQGVFYSNNAGSTWISVNSGLLSTNMTFISTSNDALYAGTFGGGLWSRPVLEICNPAVPVITVSDINTATPALKSSVTTGNQWYLNGALINGATNQTYVANSSGIYKVVATIGSCSSTSADLPLVVTGVNKENPFFIIYPNPTKEWITVNLQDDGVSKEVSILTPAGINVVRSLTFDKKIQLATNQLAQGLYFIKVETAGRTEIARFVKE